MSDKNDDVTFFHQMIEVAGCHGLSILELTNSINNSYMTKVTYELIRLMYENKV